MRLPSFSLKTPNRTEKEGGDQKLETPQSHAGGARMRAYYLGAATYSPEG
jgi:hypothetical protein